MNFTLKRKQKRFNLKKRSDQEVYYWTAVTLIVSSLWLSALL